MSETGNSGSWMQDVVTRGGKFLYMYKRPGKRVIVNDFGHMMVCPSLIETSLQQNTAGEMAVTRMCHARHDQMHVACMY